VRLVPVLLRDLHAAEDCGVGCPGIVVEEQVSEHEDNGDGDNYRPYFRYCLRRYSKVTKLFCDEPRLAYC
jgi:hypothetical protein